MRRAQAHVLLGERAQGLGDDAAAALHFREAIDLDPTDERPRAALLGLEGLQARTASEAVRKRRFWGWLTRRRAHG